jgi:hypothetical protein
MPGTLPNSPQTKIPGIGDFVGIIGFGMGGGCAGNACSMRYVFK